MNTYHMGIVLKHHAPFANKINLLDKNRGHIVGILHHASIASTSILTYQLKPASSSYFFIQNITLFDMPLQNAQTQLLFLHQIIEIMYYFLPEQMPVPTIYHFLAHLYQLDISQSTRAGKLLFLCKLFRMLGFEPPPTQVEFSLIHELLYSPIDVLLHTRVSANVLDVLHHWFTHCISMHPHAHILRTYDFSKTE